MRGTRIRGLYAGYVIGALDPGYEKGVIRHESDEAELW